MKMSGSNQATNIRTQIIPVILMIALFLGSTGCGASGRNAAASLQDNASPACDASQVSVTGVHWFRDTEGAWRVVGLITNHSSEAVSKLVTGVETRTASGQAADQGEDISAYPLDLRPGEQAPYTAWIDREIPGLDHFEVEVNECVPAEPAERSQVEVRGTRLGVDGAGKAQVTAELLNTTAQTILVNGLMAAVYDQAGTLIAAQYADVTPRYLAPGESGPVRVSLFLPKGSEDKVSSSRFFMEVLANQPASLPPGAKQDFQILSHYVDTAGHFHLLGTITNQGKAALMTSLQATAYADAGRGQVIDASQMTTWVPILPGEALPFDLTDWGPLSYTKDLASTWESRKSELGFRLEPFLTWTATSEVKTLTLSDGTVAFKDQEAVFTGKATNTSTSGITSGLVTVVLRRKANGQITAVGSTHLDITDSAAPGQTLDYSIRVPLPVGVDPNDLSSEILARGYQP